MPLAELEPLLKTVAQSRSRFLFGLDCVPEERLGWSPGGSAASPLKLAGKFGHFLGFISHMVRHSEMPERGGAARPEPATREEAKAAVEAGFEDLRGALLALTAADMQRGVPAPWRAEMSMQQALYTMSMVMGYFQGQLNYLQLAYGDEEANIPPSWGHEEI